MNLKDTIEQIWNETTEGMESVIGKLINLIGEAVKNKSDIPIEIAIDILITANTTLGYGGDYHEAELLLTIYDIALSNESLSSIPKIHHFSCLIYGVIFSLLTVDEATSDRKVPSIMKILNVNQNSSPIELIRTLLHRSYPLLDNVTPTYWLMELISFILTGICLIQDFDKINDSDISIEDPLRKVAQEFSDSLVITNWKNRWVEASDYYRFTSSLIFAEHAKEEEAWLNRAKVLFP